MSYVQDRRSTVLLVEDSLDEEMLVMRAVRQSPSPIQILAAHTTEEALDFLLGRNAFSGRLGANPDVIVTDLRVGSMGGAGLVSEIRANEGTHLIPIVVLSGSSSTSQIDELYRRGANSYIEKPTDFDEYSRAILTLVRYWGALNRSAIERKASASYPLPL